MEVARTLRDGGAPGTAHASARVVGFRPAPSPETRMNRTRRVLMYAAIAAPLGLWLGSTLSAQDRQAQPLEFDVRAHYTKYEARIPMRDGKRLFTSIYVPKDSVAPVPVPDDAHAVHGVAVRRRQLPPRLGPSVTLRPRRLHLRLPGRARPVHVRGRVRGNAPAHRSSAGQPGRRREHRHVRHGRVAAEERRRTTTARSGSGESRTRGSSPRRASSTRTRPSRRRRPRRR